MLSDKQKSIFRLMLDPGAMDAEAVSALHAFRQSLFGARLDASVLLAAIEGAKKKTYYEEPEEPEPGAVVIRFGFQKGKALRELSRNELNRLRSWCVKNDAWPDLVWSIDAHLEERVR